MDQEKPFKTIEVVDSKTNQVCKVACMSCIRGHRTTSCGIPVCRSKIFWTVKRPGRPSNSCTCRYGATGGCKCVVARSACPHKSKKGEKRSGECRCDEQGRYCCLLEPDHWTALFSLLKPVVEFFPSREMLEAKQTATAGTQQFTSIPNYAMASPPTAMTVPGTPNTNVHTPTPSMMPSPYAGFTPHSSSLTPRFGLMGIGAPQGSQHSVNFDPLMWDSNVPMAPREFPPAYEGSMSPRRSCCQTSAPSTQRIASPSSTTDQTFVQHDSIQDLSLPQPYNSPNGIHSDHGTTMPTVATPSSASAYNFERLRADYQYYQFPSAICQNCGLSGCTCKNCPPPFQNPGTGSWAQCCGRKHARDPAPAPVPNKVSRSLEYDGTRGIHQHAQEQQSGGGCCSGPAPIEPINGSDLGPLSLDHNYLDALGGVPSEVFDDFQLDHDFMIPESSTSLNMADFLVEEEIAVPEPGGEESGGCCCKGP